MLVKRRRRGRTYRRVRAAISTSLAANAASARGEGGGLESPIDDLLAVASVDGSVPLGTAELGGAVTQHYNFYRGSNKEGELLRQAEG
jgi:hypothetical protein